MSPSSPLHAAPLPRQRRKEARPQELLDAALDLFSEKGFAAARSEEVAMRAGVSKGTLYLYYPSKEELLKAVISQRLSVEIAAVAAQVDQFEGPASVLLREVYTAWWKRVYLSPTSAVFKLIIAEVRNFPELADFWRQEVVQPGQQLIGSIVARGVRSGEFRNVDLSATVLSLLFPMIMLCVHKHSLNACIPIIEMVDPLSFIDQHVELVLAGLKVPPANPGQPTARKRKT